ncbi:hypothetical protein DUNSADRAFT_13080 [Dunaliella salina]|uniref:Uncharacterized protein n=1 Tax=Dunaliella salina TaxID=3046 RepID=A0ABQ7H3G9_DUNSA|nr:hypothetical protein DUNSADRAFT_13080 [Dunaliella salina]|eukprot:KAF5841417.1 hypothetical protein DUNSADRAFT_13080 [Dunaliella salina]
MAGGKQELASSPEEEDVPMSDSAVEEDSEEDYELSGNLKTRLIWDCTAKQMQCTVRQFFQSNNKVELKYKGFLNTSTGANCFKGHLRKNFFTNQPSLQRVLAAAQLNMQRQEGLKSKEEAAAVRRELSSLNVDPDRLLPAGLKPLFLQDWIISPGIIYDSSAPSTPNGSHRKWAVTIKKMPQAILHSPRTDMFLTGKLQAEVDARTGKVGGIGSVRLKLLKYNVTSKQDLQVSVGMDLSSEPLSLTQESSKQTLTQAPYLKIGENNASLKLSGGRWVLFYEL